MQTSAFTGVAWHESASENRMRAHSINDIRDASRQNLGDTQDVVLLVGSADAFKSDATTRMLSGFQFRIARQAATLLEGLAYLQFEAIDVILFSSEFREEELSLFAFDAQRRGFTGLILHVAPVPRPMPTTHIAEATGRRVLEVDHGGQPPRHSSIQPHVPSMTSGLLRRLEEREANGSLSFTPRQQTVLARVSDGWTNRQIAQYLKCSEGSVKAVLQELFKKLGVRKRAQIVRIAFETTLIRAKDNQSFGADNMPPDQFVRR
jgi:DNA-binding CsgD family transcriptional regulator